MVRRGRRKIVRENRLHDVEAAVSSDAAAMDRSVVRRLNGMTGRSQMPKGYRRDTHLRIVAEQEQRKPLRRSRLLPGSKAVG